MLDAMNRPIDDNAKKQRNVELDNVVELTLPDFVTQSFKQLIDSFLLPVRYLDVNPAEWEIPTFKQMSRQLNDIFPDSRKSTVTQ